jgi:hypothetical protein
MKLRTIFGTVAAAMLLVSLQAWAASPKLGEPDPMEVMLHIQSSKTDAARIQALTVVPSLRVVKVREFAQGEDLAALEEAVRKSAADIAALRIAFDTNAPVGRQLQQAGVDVATIVGANVSQDGVLTVYVI